MLLNMDAELQHLISISIDKLTTGTGGQSCAGRSERKSRGIDLRKALFVAHVLQEVRCAYLEDDYEIVANTLSDMRSANCKSEADIRDIDLHTVKDIHQRRKEESHTYLMETDTNISDAASPSSPSVLQSCVTNTDVTVSRISQVTRPVSVSVNTAHVMSFQSFSELSSAEERSDDDSPVICEELELSHCCEVVSSLPDDDGGDETRDAEVESRERLCAVNRMQPECGSFAPETVRNDITTQHSRDYTPVVSKSSDLSSTTEQSSALKTGRRCPLPKKKRPLPREFLDDSSASAVPVSKASKCATQRSDFSYAHTSTTTVTLESRTSTSISTVYSTIGTVPSFSTGSSKFQPGPKVVVQMTQSCDSYLPITCAQLSRCLGELSTFALPHSALA